MNKSEIKSQIDRLREIEESAMMVLDTHIQSVIPTYNRLNHVLGTWDCEKSPVGYCMYHRWEDTAMDGCLYCGEPHERK